MSKTLSASLLRKPRARPVTDVTTLEPGAGPRLRRSRVYVLAPREPTLHHPSFHAPQLGLPARHKRDAAGATPRED